MNAVLSRMIMVAMAAASATVAFAQYPTKPVRIISPAPPGGGTELAARLVQTGMQESLKQPVIIEARGGAGGYIGSDLVSKSQPDGYTLLLGGAFTTITATLQKNPAYNPRKDLIPIAIISSVPNILIAGPNLKVSSVAELVAHAKANPGKLNIGSNGVGTTLHLSGELFKLRTGTDMLHIAYKGWADCVTGLLGGQVDLMFDNLSTALANVNAHKTRALAVAAFARHRSLPDVPTLGELGIKDAEVISWFGIMAPAGTPQTVLDTLGRAVKNAADHPDFPQQVAKTGMDASYQGAAEAARFWSAEVDKWESVIKAAGIIGQ